MQTILRRARSLSLVVIAILLSTSCTSYRPIALGDTHARLKAGDTVKVTTRDGKQAKFEVATITSDVIAGDDQQIELADIKELEKREVSAAKTTGLVLVGLTAAALVVMAAAAAATASVLDSGQ